MILTLILALFGLLMMAVLLLAVRGQSVVVHNLRELEGRTQPVDLDAFRNLTDPREEEYLRQNLEIGRASCRERV